MHFLGKNIRHLRKRSSQNQLDIAALVHKGQTTIGNWENGVSEPSLGDLLIISNYFGISIDTLLRTDLREAKPSCMIKEVTSLAVAPEPVDYHHNKVSLSLVRENEEDRFYPILEEIKTIRSEIERIKTRLPGGQD